MNKNIDLIYFNAGGGHRASARALEAVLKNSHPHWNVRLVNLFEVLDSRQVYKRVTGVAPEEFYNRQLAKGWTMAMTPELRILQAFIRLTHQVMVKRLQEHWIETEPDMVVSLVPNFNRAMYESLVSSLPGVPYVTILTDLADNAPHFWIEKTSNSISSVAPTRQWNRRVPQAIPTPISMRVRVCCCILISTRNPTSIAANN